MDPSLAYTSLTNLFHSVFPTLNNYLRMVWECVMETVLQQYLETTVSSGDQEDYPDDEHENELVDPSLPLWPEKRIPRKRRRSVLLFLARRERNNNNNNNSSKPDDPSTESDHRHNHHLGSLKKTRRSFSKKHFGTVLGTNATNLQRTWRYSKPKKGWY